MVTLHRVNIEPDETLDPAKRVSHQALRVRIDIENLGGSLGDGKVVAPTAVPIIAWNQFKAFWGLPRMDNDRIADQLGVQAKGVQISPITVDRAETGDTCNVGESRTCNDDVQSVKIRRVAQCVKNGFEG